MIGFCRKADEFRIEDLGLSNEVLQFVGDEEPAEFLSDVRNKIHYLQLIYYYYKKYSNLGSKKACDVARRLSSIDGDIISKKLLELGFLREELDNYEDTPEGYFMFVYWQYLPESLKRYCDRIFYKGRFLSLGRYVDNREYETYVYSEFNLQRVLKIMWNLLPAKQFEVLQADIMTEGRTCFDSKQRALLMDAKERLSSFSSAQVSDFIADMW